jgi:hypothetical protein
MQLDPSLTEHEMKNSKDRTKDKDRFAYMLKGWIDKFAVSMSTPDTKNYIQQLVIDPFLQYIFNRSFPYMIITVCVFSAILIIVILIFVLLLINHNKTNICGLCNAAQS